jgi:hypothetical protein
MAHNDDPEERRGRPRTSHTEDNCVIVEGLIREDRRVKVREALCKKKKTVIQHFASLGKEHYRDGMFKFVKQWDKFLKANGDCVRK